MASTLAQYLEESSDQFEFVVMGFQVPTSDYKEAQQDKKKMSQFRSLHRPNNENNNRGDSQFNHLRMEEKYYDGERELDDLEDGNDKSRIGEGNYKVEEGMKSLMKKKGIWIGLIVLIGLIGLIIVLGLVAYRMWTSPNIIYEKEVNRTVIMVSLDGFRPDYLEMFREECGNLTEIISNGVKAASMTPIFPSKTFPNHYTLVTGLYAESHGIISNTFWDPNFKAKFSLGSPESFKSRWWLGEPIWVTAEKQGKVSASFFWPGSDVEIQGMYPTYYKRYDGRIDYDTRVKTVFEWLDSNNPPQMILTYFSSVDTVGHNLGPIYSEALRNSVRQVNDAVGLILQGLKQRNLTENVDLVIVSDHGMSLTPKSKIVRLTDILQRNVLDGVEILNMNAGPYLDMYINNKTKIEGLYTELVESIRNNSDYSKAVEGVYTKSNMPESFHFTNSERIPDLIILANPEFSILRNSASALSTKGNHGYNNESPDMGSLFIAQGKHFKRGLNSPDRVRNLDVYSLICKLLDLVPAPNNGTADNFSSYLSNI